MIYLQKNLFASRHGYVDVLKDGRIGTGKHAKGQNDWRLATVFFDRHLMGQEVAG